MLITGCHRSGTSLLASILVDVLGQRRDDDLPPGPDNPRGFFESRQLTCFNDVLLGALGGDWCHPPLLPTHWAEPPLLDLITAARADFRAYAQRHDWVDKDPRLCLTLPAFQHLLLRRVPVLVALRHPHEVAASLHLRNGFPFEHGLALWFLYNHHLSVALQPSDLLITYSELLQAPAEPSVSERLRARLAIFLQHHGHPAPTPSSWGDILARRVDPGLNRASVATSIDGDASTLFGLTDAAYAQAATGLEGHRAAFAALPHPVLAACAHHALTAPGLRQQQRLEALKHSLQQCQAKAVGLEQQLHAVHHSNFWKATAPLRRLLDRFR